MPTQNTIGELFAATREAAALSQQALAERARVGVSTVSRLERDGTTPRARNLAKLAAILGITPEQLEAFGLDAAADTLRNSPGHARGMTDAFATLVGAEITLTRLGFQVTLEVPREGVLQLTCERRSTPEEASTRSALVPRGRDDGWLPPGARRISGDT